MVQTIDEIKKHITIQKYKYIKQVDKIRQKDHHFTKNKTSRKANKQTRQRRRRLNLCESTVTTCDLVASVV